MTKMKKHLSVFGLFTRSSVYKVLLILIAMCAVQSLCFYMEVQDAVAAYEAIGADMASLEKVFEKAAVSVYFRVALVLVSVAICLPGCAFKSNTGYTVGRLSVSERAAFFWQAAYNMLAYWLLLAVQLVTVFGLARYYVAAVPDEFVSNQTIMLAFYRNSFLHSLLPMEDIGLWIRNGLLVLSLGMACAEFPYRQRRHKFSATAIALVSYTIVYFDQSIGKLVYAISSGVIALVIIGEVIYMLTRKDEEAVQDD